MSVIPFDAASNGSGDPQVRLARGFRSLLLTPQPLSVARLRDEAFRLLAAGALDPTLKDFIRRSIAGANRLPQLKRLLSECADRLEASQSRAPFLARVPLQDGDRTWIAPCTDILFFHTAVNGAATRKPRVSVRIYARTALRDFPSQWRSLADLERRLAPALFYRVSQSALVQLRRIKYLDKKSTPKCVYFETPAGLVRVPVSRRAYRELRGLLGVD